MKKALITIIMIMTLSAGILFSAGNHISANELTSIDSITVNDNQATFYAEYRNYDAIQVQYTYIENDILITKLSNISIDNIASRVIDGWYLYQFELPSNALSFIIRQGMDGLVIDQFTNNEYIFSQDTRVQNADMSIKQIVINEDLITKKPVWSDWGQLYEFVIHFNIEDENGDQIPIDRIASVTYEYDVVNKELFNTTRTPMTIEIDESTYNQGANFIPVFPYYVNDWITNNIYESEQDGYTWSVNLGQYRASSSLEFLSDVNIDQTQMIHIEYYSEGTYISTDEIVDDPYDQEDIVYTTFFEQIKDLINNLGDSLQIIMYIAIAIVGLLVISLVLKIFGLLKFIGKLISKTIKLLYRVAKFIVWDSTKHTVKLIWLLIVPREKRKERGYNANRYF
jgi:hypothetical protein